MDGKYRLAMRRPAVATPKPASRRSQQTYLVLGSCLNVILPTRSHTYKRQLPPMVQTVLFRLRLLNKTTGVAHQTSKSDFLSPPTNPRGPAYPGTAPAHREGVSIRDLEWDKSAYQPADIIFRIFASAPVKRGCGSVGRNAPCLMSCLVLMRVVSPTEPQKSVGAVHPAARGLASNRHPS